MKLARLRPFDAHTENQIRRLIKVFEDRGYFLPQEEAVRVFMWFTMNHCPVLLQSDDQIWDSIQGSLRAGEEVIV